MFRYLLYSNDITVCNFGYEWEVGDLTTHAPYKAGSAEELHVKIGVRMGLRGVNITLKGNYINVENF